MRLVISTCPIDRAPEIARALVEEHLVACVNVVPAVRSFYVWQGKLEDDQEALMLIKTTAARVESLTARLKSLHPYSVPEIISLVIAEGEGNPDYLRWVREAVSPT